MSCGVMRSMCHSSPPREDDAVLEQRRSSATASAEVANRRHAAGAVSVGLQDGLGDASFSCRTPTPRRLSAGHAGSARHIRQQHGVGISLCSEDDRLAIAAAARRAPQRGARWSVFRGPSHERRIEPNDAR